MPKLFGGGQPELKLANPIAADMSDMRPSLLPGLIAAAQRNADKGIGDVALFEVSGTYEGDAPGQQRRVAAGVRRGTARLEGSGRHWSGNAGAGRRVRRQGRCARRARSLRRAGRQAADRGRRARLVSSRPLGRDQARPEDGARPFRRVPPEDAGSARRVRPALRLRGLRRRRARAEGQADAHQAEARPVGLPGGEARLRLRRRQGGRGRHADQGGARAPTGS